MNENGLKDTANLGSFAAIINSRLGVQARIARAKGFGWACGGIAIALCLTGVGALLAFYGYSRMISIRSATERVAQVFSQALEHAQLTTTVTGKMSLPPNSEIKLADGQTVKLEQRSPVKLDPSSSVRIVGDLRVNAPQPSKEQLQINAASRSGDLPFTDYTIFRSINYGIGSVDTAWNFDLADTTRPTYQYCQYIEQLAKGKQVRYVIGKNGEPMKLSTTVKPPLNFDFDHAFSNCVWFSGM
jgi:hypothetical protein